MNEETIESHHSSLLQPSGLVKERPEKLGDKPE